MSRKPLDFLVLGGGPAGAAFTCLAARDGARVRLVERHGHAARRPGEYLDGSVTDLLGALGIGAEDCAGIAEPGPGVMSLWDSPVPVTLPFRAGSGRPSLAVRRHAFDALLCRAARSHGARVAADGVAAIVPAPGGWSATLMGGDAVLARCIVDASGRGAAFARTWGARRRSDGGLFATALWFGARRSAGTTVGPLVIEAAGDGWWSLARTPGGEMAAVYYTHRGGLPGGRGPRIGAATARLDRAPYVAGLLSRRAGRVRDARSFAAFPSRLDRVCGEGWVAIGDAAASYDPLCGKGAVFALQSAVRAWQAWSADEPGARATYADAVTARYENHLVSRREVYAMAGGRLSDSFRAGC